MPSDSSPDKLSLGSMPDRPNLAHEMRSLHNGKTITLLKVENMEGKDPFGDENGAAVKYKTMAWW